MNVYCFNRDRIYTITKLATLNPAYKKWNINSQKYLLNRTETLTQIPDYDEQVEVPYWDGKKWDIIPNFFGKQCWVKKTGNSTYVNYYGGLKDIHTFNPYLGAPYLWSDTKNDWEFDLEWAKQLKYQEIKEHYNLTWKEQILFSTTLEKEVNANQQAINDISVLLKTTPNNASIDFRLYDNTFKRVTISQLTLVLTEIISNWQLLKKKLWELQSQIDSAIIQNDINNIIWKE